MEYTYLSADTIFQDLLDRRLLLTRKLLNQGFLVVKLKSSLRKFYGRHHDLVLLLLLPPLICKSPLVYYLK